MIAFHYAQKPQYYIMLHEDEFCVDYSVIRILGKRKKRIAAGLELHEANTLIDQRQRRDRSQKRITRAIANTAVKDIAIEQDARVIAPTQTSQKCSIKEPTPIQLDLFGAWDSTRHTPPPARNKQPGFFVHFTEKYGAK